MDRPLRIGFSGGVPPALGGGGMEIQIARTAAALRARGHEVIDVATAPADTAWDLVHAFSCEPDHWFRLVVHWHRNPAPLVLTSIVVLSPGREAQMLRAGLLVPKFTTGAKMRAQVVQKADVVIAGSRYEGTILRQLGADADRIRYVDNGCDRTPPGALPDGVPAEGTYALLLGQVQRRKRQREVVAALGAAGVPTVIAGGFDGSTTELAEWEATVRETGSTWLGRITDPAVVAALRHGARALVHLSAAETQSLAVMEALGDGLPVIASAIPSHEELAERFPGWVRVVGGVEEAATALAALERPDGPPPAIPTWNEVAGTLEGIYRTTIRDAGAIVTR